MYPFIRLGFVALRAQRQGPMPTFDTNVTFHRCWPWDVDFAIELNNGRSLTLMDLGRVPLFIRVGLMRTLSENKWQMAIAGTSVRYRRRIHTFEKFAVHSRFVGFDERFPYVEQSIVKTSGQVAHHALFRLAITDQAGIVTTDRVISALGVTEEIPQVPDWVRAWADADAERPWPPMEQSH